jgi:hypothetical protein
MTFVDLMDAHEALNIRDHIERVEMERVRKNGS